MKKIRLTQGKVCLVDNENYQNLNRFKWFVSFERGRWYAGRQLLLKNGKQIILKMHRVILNAPVNIQCDHRNGNSLDNRKENLRLCTNRQNSQNKKYPYKNNKLQIKGVSARDKKFRAAIQVNGKYLSLGYFNILGDADSAYRKAEEKYFGKFARNHNSFCGRSN